VELIKLSNKNFRVEFNSIDPNNNKKRYSIILNEVKNYSSDISVLTFFY